jgi:succinoglycan biosynthesis transport protein ExoP
VVERLLHQPTNFRQILVTSAGEQEGKTVTAVNLALAFHVRRVPILLAELSLRKPYFSQVFSPSPLPRGIEAVLAEGTPLESTICVRNDNNLRIAMVNQKQSTDDLLAPGERLDKLLRDARGNYDWTVFDAPSADTPHIRTLAASVGLVLLVARAGHTRPTALRQAIEHIGNPNTMVLLNDN